MELIVVQLPGRENRFKEPFATEMNHVISDIVSEMKELLDLPFSFFGHSLGGLLAYECCVKLLTTNHARPCHLVVSGANPPDWKLSLSRQTIRDMALTRLCSHFGWTDTDEIDQDIVNFSLHALHADLDLMLRHPFSQVILPLHLTGIGASDDPIVSQNALRHWASFATSQDFIFTTSGHFFLDTKSEQIVKVLTDHAQTKQTYNK